MAFRAISVMSCTHDWCQSLTSLFTWAKVFTWKRSPLALLSVWYRDEFKCWSALEENGFWQSTFSWLYLTVKAGIFFDAWMEAFCSKGLTFSEHFFEMIIHYLAAGGTAILLANRVNLSQMWELLADSPDLPCQCLTAVGPAKNADRRVWGWRGADSSRKGNGFPVKVVKYIWIFMCIYTKLWVWLPLRTKLGFCVHFRIVCCVPVEDAGVCNYSGNKTWIWSTCLRLNSVQSSMANNKGSKH